jgi:branched-chain amino acid transport system ATP-binding protein
MNGLKIKNLSVARGEAVIVHEASLEVPRGQVTVLLGPNGAGKTTLLESISGVIPVKSGSIRLGEMEMQKASRVNRARAGLAHVQQGRVVFPSLTVEENLLVGVRGSHLEPAFTLFPELEKRRFIAAGKLSGGEQQMVVLARAILGKPSILLVDEMSLGLAPLIVKRLMPVMRSLADDGVGVLLVEQFAQLALSVADSALVMNQGRIVYSGSSTALLKDSGLLQRTYLGQADVLEVGGSR